LLKNNIFKKYKNNYFVETGCLLGAGIKNALQAGFQYIYSIELSPHYYKKCQKKFKDSKKVKLILGDSCQEIYPLIKDINEPITFWLDGHYSGGNTASGQFQSPLIQELEQIKNHHIKNHTIIIDDMREWKNHSEFTHQDIYNKLKEINQNYQFILERGVVENDVLVAEVS
jgi:hypothetical protein